MGRREDCSLGEMMTRTNSVHTDCGQKVYFTYLLKSVYQQRNKADANECRPNAIRYMKCATRDKVNFKVTGKC